MIVVYRYVQSLFVFRILSFKKSAHLLEKSAPAPRDQNTFNCPHDDSFEYVLLDVGYSPLNLLLH